VSALEQVKRDWRWVSDGDKDKWTLPPLEGPFEGDCEEFALAVLLRHAGSKEAMFDLLKDGTARIERVLSDNGNGHAVLWLKGAGYVDSNKQRWRGDRGFEHVQTFSARDVRRKLEGQEVRGPTNKKMLVLATLCAAGTLYLIASGM